MGLEQHNAELVDESPAFPQRCPKCGASYGGIGPWILITFVPAKGKRWWAPGRDARPEQVRGTCAKCHAVCTFPTFEAASIRSRPEPTP